MRTAQSRKSDQACRQARLMSGPSKQRQKEVLAVEQVPDASVEPSDGRLGVPARMLAHSRLAATTTFVSMVECWAYSKVCRSVL